MEIFPVGKDQIQGSVIRSGKVRCVAIYLVADRESKSFK